MLPMTDDLLWEMISTTYRDKDELKERGKNRVCSFYFKLSTSAMVNNPL